MSAPARYRTVADFVLDGAGAPDAGVSDADAAGLDTGAAGDARAERAVLVEGDRRVGRAELGRAVRVRSAGLRRAGLDVGDRVVLQLGTGVDFVSTYLGALHAGLIVVPVNPAYTVPELRHVLVDSGARALVTSSATALLAVADLRAAAPALALVFDAGADAAGGSPGPTEGVVPLASVSGDPVVDDPAATEPGAAAPEDIGVILYTSGTSGEPKGAMLSHRALLANVGHITGLTPPLVTADDVVFLPVPLSHILGLNAALAPALAVGATVVLNDRFDPARTLASIASERVSVVVGAPSMFAAWSDVPDVGPLLADVRLALSGSAPLPPALVARYADLGVPLHEGYGMTEAAPVVAVNLIDASGASRLGHPKAGSVGAPPPGVEVELRDRSGEAVDSDDSGHLAVRGANLFSGYWPDRRDAPDQDGWFVTGDLAYRDDDGDLVLVGRDSDLVLVNGFNVYPAEVEVVLAALDGVAAAAVVGVADGASGESLRAFVVPERGRELVASDLLAGAAMSLARFKLPREVSVVDALPYTLTGKVKKWQLTAGSGRSAPPPSPAPGTTTNRSEPRTVNRSEPGTGEPRRTQR